MYQISKEQQQKKKFGAKAEDRHSSDRVPSMLIEVTHPSAKTAINLPFVTVLV